MAARGAFFTLANGAALCFIDLEGERLMARKLVEPTEEKGRIIPVGPYEAPDE
jgi:hypothetical protein